MNRKPPLKWTMGNLIAARSLNDVWAVYRVRTRSYRTEPLRRKATVAGEIEAFAGHIQKDFQILRVNRAWDSEGFIDQLRMTTPQRAHAKLWHDWLDKQENALAALAAREPATFIIVRLADPFRDPTARANRLFHYTPREHLRNARTRLRMQLEGSLDVEDISQRRDDVARRVTECVAARAATPAEIQWLIRRAYCRGLGEPEISPTEQAENPYQEAELSMVRWLEEDAITPQFRHTETHSSLGTSFQLGLCLGALKDALAFSRAVELMFTPVEDPAFAVDSSLNVRWVDSDQAHRKADSQLARTHHQFLDEDKSHVGSRDQGQHRAVTARDLEGRLSHTGEPMMEGSLTFMLATGVDAASDKEERAQAQRDLYHNAQTFRDKFPAPLHWPFGDQFAIFEQNLPAQKSLVRGYTRRFTAQQIGAMVPQATHEAGSDTKRAVCIGWTLHGRKPVGFDLGEGSQGDDSSVTVLLGTQGGGKTVTLQFLNYLALVQGYKVANVEPKGDHKLHLIPGIREISKRIIIGPNDEYRGMLDPLRIAPESLRHDSTATFLTEILPRVGGEIESAVNGAIGAVIAQKNATACCWDVVNWLCDSDEKDAQMAGTMLRRYADSGIARLGFATPDQPIVDEITEQYVSFNTRALPRIEAGMDRSEMTQGQRHGRAILQLVALKALDVVQHDIAAPKQVSFDEAGFMLMDSFGRQTLDEFARFGRADNCSVLLASQLLSDVIAQAGLVGRYFGFKMKSRPDARAFLSQLDLQHPEESDGPLVDALTERYSAGRCIHRDLQGRTEEMQIALWDEDFLEALRTTPDEEDEVQVVRAQLEAVSA